MEQPKQAHHTAVRNFWICTAVFVLSTCSLFYSMHFWSKRHEHFERNVTRQLLLAQRTNNPCKAQGHLEHARSFFARLGPVPQGQLTEEERAAIDAWQDSLSDASDEVAVARSASTPEDRRMAMIRANQLLNQPQPDHIAFYPLLHTYKMSDLAGCVMLVLLLIAGMAMIHYVGQIQRQKNQRD